MTLQTSRTCSTQRSFEAPKVPVVYVWNIPSSTEMIVPFTDSAVHRLECDLNNCITASLRFALLSYTYFLVPLSEDTCFTNLVTFSNKCVVTVSTIFSYESLYAFDQCPPRISAQPAATVSTHATSLVIDLIASLK